MFHLKLNNTFYKADLNIYQIIETSKGVQNDTLIQLPSKTKWGRNFWNEENSIDDKMVQYNVKQNQFSKICKTCHIN